MKRTMTILAAMILLCGISVAHAVDKEKKSSNPTPKKQTNQPAKPGAKKPDTARRQSAQKFDTFVDKNNNGIDDRKENLTKKPVEKKDDAKEKKEETKDTTGGK